MLASTVILVAAAMLASASPINPRQDTSYTFSITDWNFGCSPATCGWSFNVSAPSGGDDTPAFGPVSCTGSMLNNPDYYPCSTISDVQSVSAFVKFTDVDGVNNLYIKEWVTGTDNGALIHAGAVTTNETQYCDTCPTTYSVPVTIINSPCIESI